MSAHAYSPNPFLEVQPIETMKLKSVPLVLAALVAALLWCLSIRHVVAHGTDTEVILMVIGALSFAGLAFLYVLIDRCTSAEGVSSSGVWPKKLTMYQTSEGRLFDWDEKAAANEHQKKLDNAAASNFG